MISFKKYALYLTLLSLSSHPAAFAQSKLYLSGGVSEIETSSSIPGDLTYGTKLKFNYPSIDIEYQTRMAGSLHFVAGTSIFTAGYAVPGNSFGSASNFKAVYVAIPLMARWNAGNKNYFYLDFGIVPFYLVSAHLKESIVKFNNTVTVEGDITKYSNRFHAALKVQLLALIHRVYLGFYIIVPEKGQSTLNGLEGNWGLNGQQSTYLLTNGFSDYDVFGIKVGLRIK